MAMTDRFRGRFVTLEPLRPEHADELWPAVRDPAMAAVWPRPWNTRDDVRAQIEAQVADADAEPLLVRDATRPGRPAVGSSSFYDLGAEPGRLRVGWTYFAPAARRTAANTETKLLMLADAFERRGVRRVRFDVDGRNEASQDAMLRLGAVREGVLRRHRRLHDGFVRDTVVFSILDSEWPAVRARLEERLARHADAS